MLEICNKFFEYLNKNEIRYCHWKSNINLGKSLNGKTDLDLLVHSEDQPSFQQALKIFNIKKILSPPEKQFPGMDDYLGFDEKTGELIHLHIHFKLVLGQKYIKNHHLPIECLVFDNLISKQGVYIPCPEIELLLLVVRAHMKVDVVSLLKHGIKDALRHSYTSFPSAIEQEFKELISSSNSDKFRELLIQSNFPLAGNRFFYFFRKFTEGNLTFFDTVNFQWKILSALKDYRRCKSFSVYLDYAQLYLRNFPLLNRVMRPNKKKIEGEGKVFSLVGADGSGKSTLVSSLYEWLSWKLDVSNYYYGIPKTAQVRLFSFLIRGLTKCRLNHLASSVESLLWLYVARQRLKVSLDSTRDVQKGKLVVTDRFPLSDFHKMPEPMDGPRISKCIDTPNLDFVRAEEAYYNRIKSPSRIFVLQVKLDELRRRKDDLDFNTHKCKAEAVNSIVEGGPVVLIDANRQYGEVEMELKKAIWAML